MDALVCAIAVCTVYLIVLLIKNKMRKIRYHKIKRTRLLRDKDAKYDSLLENSTKELEKVFSFLKQEDSQKIFYTKETLEKIEKAYSSMISNKRLLDQFAEKEESEMRENFKNELYSLNSLQTLNLEFTGKTILLE